MEHKIVKIVEHVLIQNKIRDYNKKDLELQLQIHPNYPSFQSITDTLDYFDIDNIAVEVPLEALDQLPNSFISLVKTEKGEEIVSVKKKNDVIRIKQSSLKQHKYTLDEFKTIWEPKVIAVEYNETQKLTSNQSFLQNLLLFALGISLVFIFIDRSWSVAQVLFLTTSLAGAIFSFFALRESLGFQSQAIHQFCTSVGNSNCGDVINNASGKLFKNLSLADAGVLFFGSLLLYQIFYGFQSVLLIPSLIGVPFVIYSLYSQAFIIKKWCAICLAISVVSIAITIIAIRSFSFTFEVSQIPGFLLITTVFALSYLFIKERIKENKTYRTENLRLNQFKRDSEIFSYLLSISEKILDNRTIDNEIVLGNPNSTFKIISLTNPMCGYCKDAFNAYAKVIKAMGSNLQIAIRLNLNLEDPSTEVNQIGLRLFEIYHDQGQEEFINAYSTWFEDRTYTNWIKKFGQSSTNPKYIQILNEQSSWAKTNNLMYTPASLVNQSLYPKKYSYHEFFYFISILLENYIDEISEQTQAVAMP